MLEPHAAHEPIHTVRSFLIHIAAIAVGLLLALVLEQTVVGIHHAHQRREVETQMREVLSSNVKVAEQNFGTLRSMRSYLLDLRTDIQKRYVVSPGSLELGGVAKGPNLDTLSPAELNDYLARVGALIHETELLYARLDLVDQEFRGLLAGARNENELFDRMNRARPHGFGLAIGQAPEK